MIRTFIYGSCVSRDTFEFFPAGDFSLLSYTARQSLASAFAQHPSASPDVVPDSPFQARMMRNDWTSSLAAEITARGATTDLVLWDLCDERLGYFDLGDGHIVTRSVELIQGNLASLPADARHVDLGEAEHFATFVAALDRFATVAGEAGLRQKLVLVAPPWALEDDTGAPTPSSFGRSAHEANELFKPYLEAAVETFDCPVVGSGLRPTANSEHKWGRAPFHYSNEVYRTLVQEIMTAVPHIAKGV